MDDQSKEGIGKVVGLGSGLLAGFKLGSVIPIPVIGPVVGAAAGAVIGSEVGKRVGKAAISGAEAFVGAAPREPTVHLSARVADGAEPPVLRGHRADPLRGPGQRQPAGVPLVRRRPRRGRPDDGGPPALRGLLLAQLQLARHRHLRRRHARPAVARRAGRRSDGRGASRRWTPRSSSSTSSACRSTASTTATSRPRARRFEESCAQPRRDGRRAPPSTRSAPACGCCGAPPTCSPTRATWPARRPTPTRRCSPTPPRRCAHCLEATHRLGGANYVLWGGREGYETLLNTDMQRELDQLGRFLHHRRRAQAHDRLRGHDPDRAEAVRADQAPVRLRRRRRATASSQRYGLEDEIKVNIEVNHATLAGPRLRTTRSPPRSRTGSSARSTPTPATTALGWDTRPVPGLGRADDARRCSRSCAAAGSRTGGLQLRRQAAPPVDRPRRPVPRPHRRRWTRWPGRCSSPRRCIERRRARRAPRATATPAGTASSAARSSTARTSLADLHDAVVGRRRSTRSRCRAGRSSSRTSSTATSSGPASAAMPLVLGVDCSTQSTKVEVRDADTARSSPRGGAAPADARRRARAGARAWWTALAAAIGRGRRAPTSTPSSVGRPAARHGRCSTSAARCCAPAKLWNDTESAPDAARLVEQLGRRPAWADAVRLGAGRRVHDHQAGLARRPRARRAGRGRRGAAAPRLPHSGSPADRHRPRRRLGHRLLRPRPPTPAHRARPNESSRCKTAISGGTSRFSTTRS